MSTTEPTTHPTPADGAEKTHELYMMPLPNGPVDAKEAVRWLREDYEPYQQLANNLTAQGRTAEERDAACFLGLDVQSMVEACAATIESGKPARFDRADADKPEEFESHTVALARVVGARRVLDHSRGPFEWAFDELGEELVKRLAEPLEAESKRRAAEWKPRRPPLSEVVAQEEGGGD